MARAKSNQTLFKNNDKRDAENAQCCPKIRQTLSAASKQFQPKHLGVSDEAFIGLPYIRLHTTVAVYSWSMANNFVIDVCYRCLQLLCQIA